MPKAKAKPIWEDTSIEWFFASNSPMNPAGSGGVENSSRIDRGTDADEVRACFHAIGNALETFEKPHRWSERYKVLGIGNSIARLALAREVSFFPTHNRSFWPSRIGYKVTKPELMSHYFGVSVAACLKDTDREFPGGMVASPEVRQIIEGLQPGYAKFFPVQLQFKDQIVDGYSWIIQPALVFKVDYDWDLGIDLKAGTKNPKIRMRRSKLAGIHWTQEENLNYIWSGEVVRRLSPLILKREGAWLKGLIPVDVIEA